MKTAKQILTWLAMPVFLFSFILLISVVYQRVSGKPVPTLFGCGMAAVKTGSMEPAIPAGSLIVIQEQDSYQPGDVVTYEGSGLPSVTHRVISISNGIVTAKGDANNTEDPPFPADRIIGKVRYVIPALGSILLMLQEPAAQICLLLSILLINAVPLILRRKEKVNT